MASDWLADTEKTQRVLWTAESQVFPAIKRKLPKKDLNSAPRRFRTRRQYREYKSSGGHSRICGKGRPHMSNEEEEKRAIFNEETRMSSEVADTHIRRHQYDDNQVF